MKNTIKVPWDIIISAIILTMLVFTTAQVFAHGQGKCITDVDGDVFLKNDSWVKIDDHLSVDELKKLQDGNYEHGHRNQYYDKNGNATTLSTSFFDKDGGVDKDEFYVDCPTAASPPPATVTTTPDTSVRSTVSQQYVGTYYQQIVRKQPVEVTPSCEEIDLQEFLWWGETLLALRVLPQGVSTIAGLWDAWGLSTEKGNSINVFFGNWIAYDNVTPLLQGTGDIPLEPNMGLMIEQTTGGLLNIKGCPVENSQKIWIQEGDNLIGFPEVPDLFELPSDFLSDKITSVKVQVGTPWGAMYHTINTVGDEGDIPLRAGQAIILTSTEFHSVNLSELPPAAPMAPRRGTLTMSWGAIKR